MLAEGRHATAHPTHGPARAASGFAYVEPHRRPRHPALADAGLQHGRRRRHRRARRATASSRSTGCCATRPASTPDDGATSSPTGCCSTPLLGLRLPDEYGPTTPPRELLECTFRHEARSWCSTGRPRSRGPSRRAVGARRVSLTDGVPARTPAPAASCSSTSRRAGPATTSSPARGASPARARSATPERSIRWRRACSSSASESRPACSPTSSAPTRSTTATIRLGASTTTDDAEGELVARGAQRELDRGRPDADARRDRRPHRRDRAGSELRERDQGRRQARLRAGSCRRGGGAARHARSRCRSSNCSARAVVVDGETSDRPRRARRVLVGHLHPLARARPRARPSASADTSRALRRTRVGPFRVEDARAHRRPRRRGSRSSRRPTPPRRLFERFDLTEQQAIDLGHGKRIHVPDRRTEGEPVAAIAPTGHLVGLIEFRGKEARTLVNFPADEIARPHDRVVHDGPGDRRLLAGVLCIVLGLAGRRPGRPHDGCRRARRAAAASPSSSSRSSRPRWATSRPAASPSSTST